MKQLSWSPADLGRQELVVRRIASRTEVDRRQLGAAWQRSAEQLGRLGAPIGAIACFFAGVVVGSAAARQRPKLTPSAADPRRELVPALSRALVFGVLTYARWYAAQKHDTAAAAQMTAMDARIDSIVARTE
jgi:hypothetical protein